ncbi:MAG: hypothetical protein KUA43_18725 [Hoeflea sp.]|uniref:hypothetical protein n=1 Tax=Hoeflea sp. TaxID=1940281 RepID=UPI001DD49DB8|nr:hypothetical protein [Hoeflea sp.]MBU4527198.1 hypothetical protein [Alphaproteobacteria bacterium]MBU4547019.1 hypothetical protein [Alphaproteobacteria bacterium]MBU4551469.1 hypothetical protein [Alphaproteobacteria bacterium]MBV1725474.1 hypothetical protein [Hoeflea sp.]MBV1759522.1 hypothetical protein [Hoeflea sp.]
MFSDDDVHIAKQARRESATVARIALMAVIGCLALLTVLVIQARAEADAVRYGPAAPAQQLQQKAPVQTPPVMRGSGA